MIISLECILFFNWRIVNLQCCVSGVQQSDSGIYIFLYRFFSIVDYYCNTFLKVHLLGQNVCIIPKVWYKSKTKSNLKQSNQFSLHPIGQEFHWKFSLYYKDFERAPRTWWITCIFVWIIFLDSFPPQRKEQHSRRRQGSGKEHRKVGQAC